MTTFQRVCVRTSDGVYLYLPPSLLQTSLYLQSLPTTDFTPLPLPFSSHVLTSFLLIASTQDLSEIAEKESELYSDLCNLADYLGCEEVLSGLMQGLVEWARGSVQVTEEEERRLKTAYPWAESYLK